MRWHQRPQNQPPISPLFIESAQMFGSLLLRIGKPMTPAQRSPQSCREKGKGRFRSEAAALTLRGVKAAHQNSNRGIGQNNLYGSKPITEALKRRAGIEETLASRAVARAALWAYTKIPARRDRLAGIGLQP
jgi:hypothetical protein